MSALFSYCDLNWYKKPVIYIYTTGLFEKLTEYDSLRRGSIFQVCHDRVPDFKVGENWGTKILKDVCVCVGGGGG